MDVVRCTKSFRGARSGCSVGDLLPAGHPMAKRFAQFFEPVSDYVARKYPQHADKQVEEAKPATPKKTATRKPAARREA